MAHLYASILYTSSSTVTLWQSCEDFGVVKLRTATVWRRAVSGTDCKGSHVSISLSPPHGVEFFKIPPDVLIPLTPGTPRSFLYFSNFPFISLLSLAVTLSYRHSRCHSSSLALGYSAGYSFPSFLSFPSLCCCPMCFIAVVLENHSNNTRWIRSLGLLVANKELFFLTLSLAIRITQIL
jgi:hypothetical protein